MPPASTCSPSSRVLAALTPEEPLAELTLANRFGESLPIRRLLQFWQFDQRVHALMMSVGVHRALATVTPPAKIADSETYTALVGTAVGFVVQFAALSAWQDRWGKQVLLEYPASAPGLWRALVWAGTGARPGLAHLTSRVLTAAR